MINPKPSEQLFLISEKIQNSRKKNKIKRSITLGKEEEKRKILRNVHHHKKEPRKEILKNPIGI